MEDSVSEEAQEERRKKLQLSTQQLLKEATEKGGGWESHWAPEPVELTFKKVKSPLSNKYSDKSTQREPPHRGIQRRRPSCELPLQVDDGCPLWMWRGSVEVDAPQEELLHRLLREHELWERGLHQAAVIRSVSKDAEVYHCLLRRRALEPRPPQEHLLLR